MKYADLTAVEDISCEAMTRIVGGTTFGEFNSSRILAEGERRANLSFIKFREAFFGVPNLGQLIQFGSSVSGFPGNNTVKHSFHTDLPPGLTK